MHTAICILLLSAMLAIILDGPGLRWLSGHAKLCVPARQRAGEPATRGIHHHTDRSPWSASGQEGGRPTRAREHTSNSNFSPKSNQVCGNMGFGRYQEGQLSTINPFAAIGAPAPGMFLINWHRDLEAVGPGVFWPGLFAMPPAQRPVQSRAHQGQCRGHPGGSHVGCMVFVQVPVPPPIHAIHA